VFVAKHNKTIEKEEAAASEEKEVNLLSVAGFLKDHLFELKRKHVKEE